MRAPGRRVRKSGRECMNRLDGHIHIAEGPADPAGLLAGLERAGFQGGLLISLPPPSFPWVAAPRPFGERLEGLLAWKGGAESLYPFLWIDPLEEDVLEQMAKAGRRGVSGFKVICNRFEPGHPRALEVFRAAARDHKPILFHSGILWDGQVSSRYNRPEGFEALLEVEGLTFCLAHIGWPWCDELIAVYGKFLNASGRNPALSVEMYVDLTPGTPPIYRREALAKLFTVGYDVQRNVIFGSDCNTGGYNAGWTREWVERDGAIYREIGLGEQALERIYSRNLQRFLGLIRDSTPRRAPRPGE